MPFDRERRNRRGMDRRFLWVEARRPHPERSAWKFNQLGQHSYGTLTPKSPVNTEAASLKPGAGQRPDVHRDQIVLIVGPDMDDSIVVLDRPIGIVAPNCPSAFDRCSRTRPAKRSAN